MVMIEVLLTVVNGCLIITTDSRSGNLKAIDEGRKWWYYKGSCDKVTVCDKSGRLHESIASSAEVCILMVIDEERERWNNKESDKIMRL